MPPMNNATKNKIRLLKYLNNALKLNEYIIKRNQNGKYILTVKNSKTRLEFNKNGLMNFLQGKKTPTLRITDMNNNRKFVIKAGKAVTGVNYSQPRKVNFNPGKAFTPNLPASFFKLSKV
jgi:hypothetical protein